MNNQLTYILGAGASYESVPLVKSFPSRFQEFSQFLYSATRNPEIIANNESHFFSEAFTLTFEISQFFNIHQSFDTYFKKLFHTDQLEQIRKAKKILHLYFIWEHLTNSAPEPVNKTSNSFWKQSKIDRRYDALIAGLLKPKQGKAETYCPVNFITWNYDLNLFISLKNYFSPQNSFNEFISEIEKEKNIWQIGDDISVINMNGYFFSDEIGKLAKVREVALPNQVIYKFLLKGVEIKYFDSSVSDNDSEKISFAWEIFDGNKAHKERVNSIAKEKVTKSNSVVVIGYTFPLYNRIVDYSYFNGELLKGKSLYIQDPDASKLVDNVKTDFEIRYRKSLRKSNDYTDIHLVENCDSFFVPNDIFSLSQIKKDFYFGIE